MKYLYVFVNVLCIVSCAYAQKGKVLLQTGCSTSAVSMSTSAAPSSPVLNIRFRTTRALNPAIKSICAGEDEGKAIQTLSAFVAGDIASEAGTGQNAVQVSDGCDTGSAKAAASTDSSNLVDRVASGLIGALSNATGGDKKVLAAAKTASADLKSDLADDLKAASSVQLRGKGTESDTSTVNTTAIEETLFAFFEAALEPLDCDTVVTNENVAPTPSGGPVKHAAAVPAVKGGGQAQKPKPAPAAPAADDSVDIKITQKNKVVTKTSGDGQAVAVAGGSGGTTIQASSVMSERVVKTEATAESESGGAELTNAGSRLDLTAALTGSLVGACMLVLGLL